MLSEVVPVEVSGLIAEREIALYPKDEAVYSMYAYFDESEASAEVWPAAAISSLTGTVLQWKNFDRAWLSVLTDPQYDVTDKKGRRVFHTAEFESPEGRRGTVYENWPEPKRKSFNAALLDALAQSGVQANAATVIVSEYKEVSQRLIDEKMAIDAETGEGFKVFEDKYGFCAFQAMYFVGLEAMRYYPKEEIFYFFESGSTHTKFVNALYDIFSKHETGQFFRFASKPQFVSKDFAVALQAADLIAYEAAKHNSHYRDPNPPEKHSITTEDGKAKWKTRYALLHLNERGLDVRVQHWRKGDLESFFKFREDGEPYPYDF